MLGEAAGRKQGSDFAAPASLRHLLRTGEGIGGRDLALMGRVARNAFKEFRDDEIADVHEFLSKPEPTGNLRSP